jgi:hypothetical protein
MFVAAFPFHGQRHCGGQLLIMAGFLGLDDQWLLSRSGAKVQAGFGSLLDTVRAGRHDDVTALTGEKVHGCLEDDRRFTGSVLRHCEGRERQTDQEAKIGDSPG